MTRVRRPLWLAAFAAIAGLTAVAANADGPPDRETSVVVYGNDACPKPEGDEVVVCARRPEEERYRIPAPLRHSRERHETSWGTTSAALEQEQAYTRPNSCSPVGSYGQSGCQQQMINQWYAERAARRR